MAVAPPLLPALERHSHEEFFARRNWGFVSTYIRALLAPAPTSVDSLNSIIDDSLPAFLQGDELYGVTDLSPGHAVGLREYASSQGAFKRRTFAVRIGYVGECFRGYQRQSRKAGKRRRTRRSISAGEQEGSGPEAVPEKRFQEGSGGGSGSMALIEAVKDGDGNSDGDSEGRQEFGDSSDDLYVTVEGCLVEALKRSVNAAGRTDSQVSAISQVVSFHTFEPLDEDDVAAALHAHPACAQGHIKVFQVKRMPKKYNALWSATWRRYCYLFPLCHGPYEGVDVDAVFVDACLRQLEGRTLPYDAFAYRDSRGAETCTLYRARAGSYDCRAGASSGKVLCIELVGDRFFRRQVRILVATVIRLSVCMPEGDKSGAVDSLARLCEGGDRSASAHPIQAVGLVMAGVGMAPETLRSLRNDPEAEAADKQKLMRKNKQQGEEAAASSMSNNS